MYRDPEIPSLARRIGVSSALGLSIASIGAITEAVLEGDDIIGFKSFDDLFIGVLAALLVFIYEQRRHKALLNKVRIIAAMNHHVRNALQTISYAPYTEQEKQIKLIGESVNRIQWALREILPAEESAPDTLFSHGSLSKPGHSASIETRDKLRV